MKMSSKITRISSEYMEVVVGFVFVNVEHHLNHFELVFLHIQLDDDVLHHLIVLGK